MHGLQWDYSFPRSPHGENRYRVTGYLPQSCQANSGIY